MRAAAGRAWRALEQSQGSKVGTLDYVVDSDDCMAIDHTATLRGRARSSAYVGD